MASDIPADDGFRAFVEQQWGPLVRLAYLLTGDRGHAEDLVQAALEKTHRKWGRVSRMEAPLAYVRRAMVNTATSWRRRRRVGEVPLLVTDGPAADPWPGFERRERTHRRRRRTAVAGVVVALAAAAGVQAGVVPLPAFVPGIAVTGGPGVLAEGATRGSLAGDTAFLEGMRREIMDIQDPGETWRVTDRRKITFVYASEVAGRRLVLALVPLRFGFLDDSALVWYEGEPGAAPAAMTEGGRVDGGEPVVTFSTARADAPGVLVVVGPTGSTVSVSQGFRYTPTGRVEHDPPQVQPAGTGLAEMTLPPAPIPPAITVTVTSGADVLYEGGAGTGWASDSDTNPQEAGAALIARLWASASSTTSRCAGG